MHFFFNTATVSLAPSALMSIIYRTCVGMFGKLIFNISALLISILQSKTPRVNSS